MSPLKQQLKHLIRIFLLFLIELEQIDISNIEVESFSHFPLNMLPDDVQALLPANIKAMIKSESPQPSEIKYFLSQMFSLSKKSPSPEQLEKNKQSTQSLNKYETNNTNEVSLIQREDTGHRVTNNKHMC